MEKKSKEKEQKELTKEECKQKKESQQRKRKLEGGNPWIPIVLKCLA